MAIAQFLDPSKYREAKSAKEEMEKVGALVLTILKNQGIVLNAIYSNLYALHDANCCEHNNNTHISHTMEEILSTGGSTVTTNFRIEINTHWLKINAETQRNEIESSWNWCKRKEKEMTKCWKMKPNQISSNNEYLTHDNRMYPHPVSVSRNTYAYAMQCYVWPSVCRCLALVYTFQYNMRAQNKTNNNKQRRGRMNDWVQSWYENVLSFPICQSLW